MVQVCVRCACVPGTKSHHALTKLIFVQCDAWCCVEACSYSLGQLQRLWRNAPTAMFCAKQLRGGSNLLRFRHDRPRSWTTPHLPLRPASSLSCITQQKLGLSVNASRELSWLIQVEDRGQQGRLEREPDHILHRLVRFVCRRLLLQPLHNEARWVHLPGIFRHHVRNHRSVSKCLYFPEALFGGKPAVLTITISDWSMVRTRLQAPPTLLPVFVTKIQPFSR